MKRMTWQLDHRPFPSYLLPLCQKECSCKTFYMKMSLIYMKTFHVNQTQVHDEPVGGTHSHINGFARGLVFNTGAKCNSEMAYSRIKSSTAWEKLPITVCSCLQRLGETTFFSNTFFKNHSLWFLWYRLHMRQAFSHPLHLHWNVYLASDSSVYCVWNNTETGVSLVLLNKCNNVSDELLYRTACWMSLGLASTPLWHWSPWGYIQHQRKSTEPLNYNCHLWVKEGRGLVVISSRDVHRTQWKFCQETSSYPNLNNLNSKQGHVEPDCRTRDKASC